MAKNELISAISHSAGFVLSIAGLILLVVLASAKDAWQIVGSAIFGSSLILLYLASSIYHFIPASHKAKSIFQKIDHSMIYVLIGGSYTIVCITILRGVLGWSILGVVLLLGTTGILLKTLGFKTSDWVSSLVYVAMGWVLVVAMPQLRVLLSYNALLWLFVGGVLYTIGAVFFALENLEQKNRLFGMHEIFHFFVMAGSFSHFWFALKYLV